MTPPLNVNLKPCPHGPNTSSTHAQTCISTPVLIPCPPPRSVTLTVRLGECNCRDVTTRHLTIPGLPPHNHDCPARPVRVTCSIGGETWEEIQVNEYIECTPAVSALQEERLWAICRDLWGVVKALVLGKNITPDMASIKPLSLVIERDAEFAALTKLVQAEQAAIAAQAECDAAFPIDNYVKVPAPDHRSEPRPSTVRLAAFVAHLIATVGTL